MSGWVWRILSSLGPRGEHGSAAAELGDGSEGSQWAVEGVSIGGDGASDTIVHWQFVRVGAARDVVDSNAAESSNGAEVVNSMVAVRLRWCRDVAET